MKNSKKDVLDWLQNNIPECTGDVAIQCVAIIIDILGLPLSEFHAASKFTEDLGADELEAVEIALAIEAELGVHIDQKSAKNLSTIADLVCYVKENSCKRCQA